MHDPRSMASIDQQWPNISVKDMAMDDNNNIWSYMGVTPQLVRALLTDSSDEFIWAGMELDSKSRQVKPRSPILKNNLGSNTTKLYRLDAEYRSEIIVI
ncbi:hypothetical protein Taro_032086 [Colocasia esculenta]|uniref:Uncharacterized protein n=1 Tax=Colocasia esculenta TaxID=4460 RepID=A0A843W2V4_COLES|nr:hypothetical protein [Colocasia esculenta]